MELHQSDPGGASSNRAIGGLDLANKQIAALRDKLPLVPHILQVPTRTPYQRDFPSENHHPAFEPWEVSHLQYATLIFGADRGVGVHFSQDDPSFATKSPVSAAALSNAPTPSARDPKKAAVKLSFSDYKNFKTTGVKPSPKPTPATPESRPPSSKDPRDTSTSRVTSREGEEKTNGLDGRNSSGKVESRAPFAGDRSDPRRPLERNGRPAQDRRLPSVNIEEQLRNIHEKYGSDKSRPVVNSRSEHNSQNHSSPPSTKPFALPPKHRLPPRPPSPPRLESKPQKRPLESSDASRAEKRTRIDPADSRTPSSLQKSLPRQPEQQSNKAPNVRPPTSAPRATSPLRKATSDTRQAVPKAFSSKSTPEKPLRLPPLLSPLPADLVAPSQLGSSGFKKAEEKITPPKSPLQRPRAVRSDTIVVNHPNRRPGNPAKSPSNATLPDFTLPRLLSPDLPDIIEHELQRLQQKSTALNTVEARHEKVRQPGALGVAQKTSKPKIGHPPKKSHAESTPSRGTPVVEKDRVRKSLIVKIPYKKRQAKAIKDLLRLPGRPSKEFRMLEANQKNDERLSDSEEDAPMPVSRAQKAPAGTTSKKRPSDGTSRNETAAKRPRVSENIETAKPSTPNTPAFKSPAVGHGQTRDKSLLATPKKGDAMKSVAMRKVDSNDGSARTPLMSRVGSSDGLARTPQTGTSAPASAEKSRGSGYVVNQEQLDRANRENEKFYPIGTAMKRKLQAMVQQEDISENDRLVAALQGVECILAYMLSFHARHKIDQFSGRFPNGPNPTWWEQFCPIWKFVLHSVETMRLHEMVALLYQLGAVAREELHKVFCEQVLEAAQDWKKMVDNSRERDRLWHMAKSKESAVVSALGVREMLGTWSTVPNAVAYGVAVLARFKEQYGVVGWELDGAFDRSGAKAFLSKGSGGGGGSGAKSGG